MKKTLTSLLIVTLLVELTVSGCGVSRSSSGGSSEHYVSSQVEGESEKINLDAVKTAFWDTKGKDFNEWMGAFEKRINEIYDGDGVVSIDATRETGKLQVTGYIEDKKTQGYQEGEEKLFTIAQTGDVTNDELPYSVSGHTGQPYYVGHQSILGNPFIQMMVLSHMMNSWGGRYYTPYSQTTILRDHRDSFRTSPTYATQKATNQDFRTRYKPNASGTGLASKKTFGSSSYSTTSGTTKRGWGGFGNGTTSTSKPGFSWGGRRSSSPFGGGRSRGWGGRRGR